MLCDPLELEPEPDDPDELAPQPATAATATRAAVPYAADLTLRDRLIILSPSSLLTGCLPAARVG